jgi:hypothetical protein
MQLDCRDAGAAAHVVRLLPTEEELADSVDLVASRARK